MLTEASACSERRWPKRNMRVCMGNKEVAWAIKRASKKK